MSEHAKPTRPADPDQTLGDTAPLITKVSVIVAAVAMGLSLGVAALTEHGFTRFLLAYIVNYAFFLSLALGCLFFLLFTHVSRAGWSSSMRRVPEMVVSTFPWLAAAFVPILLGVLIGAGDVYPWTGSYGGSHEAVANPNAQQHAGRPHPGAFPKGDGDKAVALDPHYEAEYTAKKTAYLNKPAFAIRWAIYLLAWSLMARFLYRNSVEQDEDGDAQRTVRMQKFAAPGFYIFALTVSFAAIDLLMSISPAWFSTVFGVYYFSGAMVGAFALMILLLRTLQRCGYLQRAVTVDHYHDLGKYLFGFVVFWAYIAFSQYMLLWYANLPGETFFWFTQRGASTAAPNEWSVIAIALIIANFFIPFLGLLSRHVKRDRMGLAFWAGWCLVFHWVDLWWMVLPELGPELTLGIPEIATFFAVGGFVLAGALYTNRNVRLLPKQDPRLDEALAFHNA